MSAPSMLMLVGLYFMVGALIVYVCMFADGNDPGVCGASNRFMTERLPGGAKKLAQAVLPARAYAWFAGLGDYVCNKPNPLLQVFYLGLIIGAYGFAVLEAYPHIPNSVVPAYHKLAAALGVAWCISTFIVACSVEAGTLTPESWRRYDNYEYDELMYDSGKEYVGYDAPKLARSKHDGVTGLCVARFDHYCAWLAQPVGERNYRWFLLFVGSHAAMLGYAGYLLGGILAHLTAANRLFEARFVNQATGERVGASYSIVLQYLLYRHTTICTLAVLCGVMCVVLIGFVGYHLYLVAQGTTTNESFKWRHLLKCHAHMLKQREWATTAVPKSKARAAAAEKAAAGAEAAGAADAAELREKAALLRTEHEELAAEAQMLLELSPADMAPPNNKYNRGFGVNLMEVLFPLCDRAAATADGKKQIAVWPLAKGGEEEPAGEEPAGTEEEPKKDK